VTNRIGDGKPLGGAVARDAQSDFSVKDLSVFDR
jgi:hypothetical protein